MQGAGEDEDGDSGDVFKGEGEGKETENASGLSAIDAKMAAKTIPVASVVLSLSACVNRLAYVLFDIPLLVRLLELLSDMSPATVGVLLCRLCFSSLCSCDCISRYDQPSPKTPRKICFLELALLGLRCVRRPTQSSLQSFTLEVFARCHHGQSSRVSSKGPEVTELLDEAQLALEAALKHDTETYGLPDVALCGLRDFLATVLCDKALAVARNERKTADAEVGVWEGKGR